VCPLWLHSVHVVAAQRARTWCSEKEAEQAYHMLPLKRLSDAWEFGLAERCLRFFAVESSGAFSSALLVRLLATCAGWLGAGCDCCDSCFSKEATGRIRAGALP